MTAPDQLEQALAELAALEKQAVKEEERKERWPTGAQRTFRHRLRDAWPFLLVKLRAAEEMEKALFCTTPKPSVGSQASCGQCPQCKARAAWQKAGEEVANEPHQ